MELLTTCPVCENSKMNVFLTVKDHFLTGEKFTIVNCSNCGFRFLNPRPDKTDISRYYNSEDYISHDAEKKSLFSMLYRIIRKSAIKNKYRILGKNPKEQNILDIGCGTGEFLSFCQKKGMTATGVEPNEKARNFAIAINNVPVFDESHLDGMTEGSYDFITLWHVLEHVHDLNERMIKIRQLLKPGGTAIIAIPNSASWDANHYKEFWAAYDLPRHLYHFNQKSFGLLAAKHNFILKKTLPLKWDAFYISLLSEKYMKGSQGFVQATINGLWSNIFASGHEKNYSSLIFILESPKNED